jgi:putative SOS response-associated peptidase YedK
MPAHWSGARHPLFNARAESIDRKPSFRKDFELRRCLMLADSFYEWKHPTKRPFRVFLKGGGMFAFAGIYSEGKAEGPGLVAGTDEADDIRTCCMITTAANALVSQIHNRMPAILREGSEKGWLKGGQAEAKALLTPYNAPEMDMFEVSMKVNSARNDSKELIERKSDRGTLREFME